MCIDSVPRFRAAQDEGEAFKANQAPRQSRLVFLPGLPLQNILLLLVELFIQVFVY
jgi:hypothetical protein